MMDLQANQSESELILGLTNGSEKAFEEIYNRYWKRLLGIALSHAQDEVIAEEMVQEVFVSLWERRGKVEIISLSAYLAKAVKFAVFNYKLKERRQKNLLAAGYNLDYVQLDESRIYARFLEEYLAGVVDSLPEKCQVVFKYSREDGLSAAEISNELGISVKTVEGHLTKALRVIRLSLKDLNMLLSIWFTL
ncbi:RNA polymerase sigma-70 factor [Dyadobacter sp. CY323]|uniref:RNA polymerase sigma-70 factor n=1 Tax=Dyadobacter sp. CY323 TaxID=2907302 RepID=UPI001F3FB6F7|nr:RNA polymerase sigma-70 factor [Dyadobacter sp. CY323]MCE6991114.1 RNA polymerase sigma-70 factor [Dyadobacter sp. CY323]